jgi:WD40 repeat protein
MLFQTYASGLRRRCHRYKQGWTDDVSDIIRQVKIYLLIYPSGHAVVDAPQTLFLIDNVMNGFSLHRLEDGACIRTYNTNPTKTFPKQVVFGEQATLIVGGSDAGTIHIFDKNEGTLRQVLQHADRGRAQTVTVRHFHQLMECESDRYKTYDSVHHSLIFGATSTNDAEPTISIWCRKRATLPSNRPLGSAIKNFMRGVLQLAIAMVIIAYVINIVRHNMGCEALTNQNAVDWSNIRDHIAGKCLAGVFKVGGSNE